MSCSSPIKGISPIKRCKSLEAIQVANMELLSSKLEKFHNENLTSIEKKSNSTSSIDVCFIYDTDSCRASEGSGKESPGSEKSPVVEDSGFDEKGSHYDVLQALEQKIDKLSDLFTGQSQLLSSLREEVRSAGEAAEEGVTAYTHLATELVDVALAHSLGGRQSSSSLEDTTTHSSAKALLDALETKSKTSPVDDIIKEALTDFLQSDSLRQQMVSATMTSLKVVVRNCLSRDLHTTYLPLLERSQRRLMRHVTATLKNAFNDIEAHASMYSRSTHKAASSIRAALESHQRMMQTCAASTERFSEVVANAVQGIIAAELKQWREKILEKWAEQAPPGGELDPVGLAPCPEMMPISPPQPSHAGTNVIDQLMHAAEINVKIQDGDVNGSFEKALTASDLSLVMAACRAADPAKIFAPPCLLEQSVLLSLVQQLATDMVHETQLKCRYLEDAIMNLDTEHPVVQVHLHAVIEEVCRYLSSFLTNYPSHMLSRRIKMIVLAAGSLLNKQDTYKIRKSLNIRSTYDS